MSANREDIIIFWDYDTTALTSASTSVSTYELVGNIRAAVAPFGLIKAFRAYTDWTVLALGRNSIRSELSSSGVALIDCPCDGRKDVSAKVLITDILIHAWDHSPPYTFVIITANRDLAYPISLLRTRNFRVILICPSTTHASVVAQASADLDWTRVALGIRGGIIDQDGFLERPSEVKEAFPSSSHHQQQSSDIDFDANHVSSLNKTGLNNIGFSSDNPSSNPPVPEHSSRPVRVRRNSTLSGSLDPRKYSLFPEFDHAFATPRSNRGTLTAFGNGPLFSRPGSRAGEQSRADSAPPNIRYGNPAAPFIPPVIRAEAESSSGVIRVSTPSIEGKQKDQRQSIEPFVPDVTLPEETSDWPPSSSIPRDVPKASDVQEKTPAPLEAKRSFASRSSSRTSISTVLSFAQSDFSLIAPLQTSTAPTSAQTARNGDSQAKPSTESSDRPLDGKVLSTEVAQEDEFNDLYKSFVFPLLEPGNEPAAKGSELQPVSEESPVRIHSPHSSPSPAKSMPFGKSVTVISPRVSDSTSSLSNSALHEPQALPLPSAVTGKEPESQKPPSPIIPAPKATVSAGIAAGTSKAPSASTSTSATSVPLASIPAKFRPLVEILRQEQRGERAKGVEKSHLGSLLPKRYPSVYKQAQCSKFKTYITLAVEAGIVKDVVDKYGDQCVALQPQYK